MEVDDELLAYYQRELGYLRERGTDFARLYPKVASRLALGADESPDPQTERLIEASAFLAARVHRDIDREFPLIAAALLDNLCPTLGQPLPSITVAALAADPRQGKITSGLRMPAHSQLRAGSGSTACRMRTAWETVIWPLRVDDTRMVDGRQLRLRLQCDEGVALQDLELDTLRLHLGGDLADAMKLYDLLATRVRAVLLLRADGSLSRLPASCWRNIGFEPETQVLPASATSSTAYALLQEYFAFPRKFHFFELDGLRGQLGAGERCEILIEFDAQAALPPRIDAQALRANCVPVVNLFPRTSEPIRVQPGRHEYALEGAHQQ